MTQPIPNLSSLSREQLEAMVAKLASNQAQPRALSCKVTEKGAVSVYGMGRFPTTLYLSQWEQLIAFIPQVEAFIATNRHLLSVKGDAKA